MAILTPSLQELTTNVELFNNITLDDSKAMFKSCLGTDFPYDVIDSVQQYAAKLTNFLNSSLDDLLCGSAIKNIAISTKDFAKTTTSQIDKYAVEPLFGSEEEQKIYEENGLKTNHTIGYNDWVRTWTIDDFNHASQKTFTSGNINADSVSITVSGNISVTKTNMGTDINPNYFYRWSGGINVSVSVSNLRRGPNDGSSPITDGTDVLSPVSGTFTYSNTINSSGNSLPTYLDFSNKTVIFSGDLGIDLTIKGFFYGLNDNTYSSSSPNWNITLSNLNYVNAWSDVSTTLNSEQKSQIDDLYNLSVDSIKNQALTSLKSNFMSSSMAGGVIEDKLNEWSSTYPALSGINTRSITDAITGSIANNAISIFEGGDSLNFDSLIKDTIATEITTSSINSVLEQNGLGDYAISTDCTKELLDNLTSTLGIDVGLGDISLSDLPSIPKLADYIPFDLSLSFANEVLGELNSIFNNSLLSSDCITAINNNFDICSAQIAEIAGGVADIATAKTTAADIANQQASKYLTSVIN